ncbi:hypothetical protein NCER_102002 [Vairimorpha ceranae BRL01]|uniref:Bos1-like vesicular transport protein n=2 Tax=Vairimorpha ceranae TaxID=40302 RepID=C4VB70_VAIC1|nr:bos1-like vesicular transport protein [Vairimorpha ceranae]EEQ81532.1 hypothetical protein NCER_102002 [Vairimorpha ceranae BRL01]KAF5139757.1 hypothetical protein G9O61_00g020940 [Vairimorpha ceranae]KAF5139842.1 hypothetical protein G9O61_00g020120 [Vairimorpha ceranae]KKO74927.1 bos1-like vesicular transport protein [Vairimorpha ceranae]
MTNLNNLHKEADEIEAELIKSENTLENIGTLAIKIQKFIKMVGYLDDANLKLKAKNFNDRIVRLSNLRLAKRKQEDEEMIKCKLTPEEPFTECTSETYYTEKTQRVNHILTDAMNILDTIQKQGRYIERANSRLKDGLIKLGFSRNLVEEIDRRYLADNRIFVTGFVCVILLFLILRFWFR